MTTLSARDFGVILGDAPKGASVVTKPRPRMPPPTEGLAPASVTQPTSSVLQNLQFPEPAAAPIRALHYHELSDLPELAAFDLKLEANRFLVAEVTKAGLVALVSGVFVDIAVQLTGFSDWPIVGSLFAAGISGAALVGFAFREGSALFNSANEVGAEWRLGGGVHRKFDENIARIGGAGLSRESRYESARQAIADAPLEGSWSERARCALIAVANYLPNSLAFLDSLEDLSLALLRSAFPGDFRLLREGIEALSKRDMIERLADKLAPSFFQERRRDLCAWFQGYSEQLFKLKNTDVETKVEALHTAYDIASTIGTPEHIDRKLFLENVAELWLSLLPAIKDPTERHSSAIALGRCGRLDREQKRMVAAIIRGALAEQAA